MTNSLRRYWSLDPEVTFINHGSYGACTKAVQEHQQQWRAEMEREPVLFMSKRDAMFDSARVSLAPFLGSEVDDIVMVPNATHGVNAVIRSQRWQAGDELLVTNHEYNACRNTLDYAADRWGAKVVVVDIPFPIDDPQQVIDVMLKAVTERTVFCLIDHITSPTALVLPLEQLVPALQEHGIKVLVDGAHAPGQLPLDLSKLNADYYTGNLHKWPCAPKGSAVLVAPKRNQAGLHPVAISHGYNADTSERSRYQQEFDWPGTFDLSAWASIPFVLEDMQSKMDGGWSAIMKHNRELAMQARDYLCKAWEQQTTAPDSMVGSMSTILVPKDIIANIEKRGSDLYTELREQWGIQVPVIPLPDPLGTAVRISAQLYNSMDDYHKLANAVLSMRTS
ncbi:MAG: aminotransferase class V-fold PLP-dependent enzyme [Planctomycetes bacterium]|nr:aminotransferase class V-fold PLP-dependent enzyme [Planctomycetota bacterium]MCP4770917.1 aminotransferase class V-fold PLP-dependent enzyme [Planctomycetota bacterium]MCP4862258.1 aminotransferase class V-fold PLP-dependent enzyme [Planctomycetota bacterium]